MRDYRAEAVDGIGRMLAAVPQSSFDDLVEAISQARRLFVTGAGRSFLFVKSLAMGLMQIGYPAYATGEVATPAIGPDDLLIVASASGSTKSVLLFVEQARAQGARIAAITSNPASPIAKAADVLVVMGGAPGQEGTPGWQTGSFFELALGPLGDAAVEQLAVRRGATSGTVAARHANLE
jgi:6-phospho-3-hexuloisomerase